MSSKSVNIFFEEKRILTKTITLYTIECLNTIVGGMLGWIGALTAWFLLSNCRKPKE